MFIEKILTRRKLIRRSSGVQLAVVRRRAASIQIAANTHRSLLVDTDGDSK